ncbi:MAG: bacteriocin [Sphingomonas sp.]|jgi:bacteriocin-like protein|uniref:bacteriocin n=1 Tax=Sphingomonas sp. TaxID=28214 RepID=UPI0035692C51
MLDSRIIETITKCELTEAELNNVVGGVGAVQQSVKVGASAGLICSFSGECNSDGSSCNPFWPMD